MIRNLRNRKIEGSSRLDLKTRGSKIDRAQRAIGCFASRSEEALRTASVTTASPDEIGPTWQG